MEITFSFLVLLVLGLIYLQNNDVSPKCEQALVVRIHVEWQKVNGHSFERSQPHFATNRTNYT